MKILFSTLAAAALAASVAAHAADPAAGQKLVQQHCVACHGEDGNSASPQFPKLAGQHADYLVRALADYASGARRNVVMAGTAGILSAADRENIAAWFASQKGGVHTVIND